MNGQNKTLLTAKDYASDQEVRWCPGCGDYAILKTMTQVLSKLQLKKDGTISKSEILDHERMNRPGQRFYKVLAESALRAVRLCQPLRVPPTGYEKWKEIQLNFDPTEMLRG